MKFSASGNVFAGFTGTSVAAAGFGLSGGKENFSASATAFAGKQYDPKKYPFLYATVGSDYVFPGQDNNKTKFSLGTWSGYTHLDSSHSGFVGVVPARLTSELPKGIKLTFSPICERFYSDDSGYKNKLVLNTMLTGPITDNLSWYACHWLFDATRHPEERANHEIDVGFSYTF